MSASHSRLQSSKSPLAKGARAAGPGGCLRRFRHPEVTTTPARSLRNRSGVWTFSKAVAGSILVVAGVWRPHQRQVSASLLTQRKGHRNAWLGRVRRLVFGVRPHEAALGWRDASRPRKAATRRRSPKGTNSSAVSSKPLSRPSCSLRNSSGTAAENLLLLHDKQPDSGRLYTDSAQAKTPFSGG